MIEFCSLSKELKVKSHDVTRASVQKSVVIVLQKVRYFKALLYI